jgi:hypothetical protein
LLLLDLIDLYRRRISKAQFVRNISLSLILVACGTFGWNIGSRWIALEILGSAVEIVGGMIGAGVLGAASSVAFDKLCGRFVKSDAQKMWEIINPHIIELPERERAVIKKQITNSDLKKMYAAKDKKAHACGLISQFLPDLENLENAENSDIKIKK